MYMCIYVLYAVSAHVRACGCVCVYLCLCCGRHGRWMVYGVLSMLSCTLTQTASYRHPPRDNRRHKSDKDNHRHESQPATGAPHHHIPTGPPPFGGRKTDRPIGALANLFGLVGGGRVGDCGRCEVGGAAYVCRAARAARGPRAAACRDWGEEKKGRRKKERGGGGGWWWCEFVCVCVCMYCKCVWAPGWNGKIGGLDWRSEGFAEVWGDLRGGKGKWKWKVRHVMVVGTYSVCLPGKREMDGQVVGGRCGRVGEEDKERKERQAAVCHGSLIDPVTSRGRRGGG